ncbi:MAG TPA: hypothetical protein VE954_30410 [Oligoflexus sp.]|nr:hypothetical protein [Oligoflexus sp.]HYX37437.1 hypothetical protein [Oligoflexus sp.]
MTGMNASKAGYEGFKLASVSSGTQSAINTLLRYRPEHDKPFKVDKLMA